MSNRFPAISLFAVGALILLILALPRAASAEAAFLDAEDAFALTVEKPAPESDQINLHWRIAPGYYLYRARIGAVEQPSGKPSAMVLPAGDQKNDPNFGAVEVYHNAVTAQINGSHAKSLTITWQGCADAGLCYPPQKQTVSVKNDARDASIDPSDARQSLMASLFSAGAVSASVATAELDTFTTVASGEALAKLLAASQSAGQPALVDFYADWCVSCKSIEKEVFSAVSVQQALAGTKLIRVDVTDNNASVRARMRRLDILGPPTVMLFDRNGIERRGARLVGEFNTDDLLQRLQVREDRS